MKKLMLTNQNVTDKDLRRLADARANGVRQWIHRQGKIDAARLFIVAPKLTISDITEQSPATRVDLSVQ